MKKNIQVDQYRTLLLEKGRIELGKEIPSIHIKLKREPETKLYVVFENVFRVYKFDLKGVHKTREVIKKEEIVCKERLWKINFEKGQIKSKKFIWPDKGIRVKRHADYKQMWKAHKENIKCLRRTYL